MVDHRGEVVDLCEANDDGIASGDDAEFLTAIRQDKKGLCSVGACLPVMRLIHQIHISIEEQLPLRSQLKPATNFDGKRQAKL